MKIRKNTQQKTMGQLAEKENVYSRVYGLEYKKNHA